MIAVSGVAAGSAASRDWYDPDETEGVEPLTDSMILGGNFCILEHSDV